MSTILEYTLALPVGAAMDQFTIEKNLGLGGFDILYKAKRQLLDGSVVLKELLPRIENEGRTLVTWRHPHVVHCDDIFRANRTAYLRMDFEDDRSSRDLMKDHEAQRRPFNEQQLLAILITQTQTQTPFTPFYAPIEQVELEE